MARTRGSPRKLTNANIRKVLRWYARERAFKLRHGTLRSLAQRLGVTVSCVRRAMNPRPIAVRPRLVPSRPLTARERQRVRRWYSTYRRFMASHQSAAQLAKSLGVCRFVIWDCIRRQGRYTQLHRSALARDNHKPVRSAQSRPSRAVSTTETQLRSSLLATWSRPKECSSRRKGRATTRRRGIGRTGP
jgi:hypothetical protein